MKEVKNMTREMNDKWQAKRYHDMMESQLASACYSNCEWDCNLCKGDNCEYCENKDNKPEPELNPLVKEFFEHCCKLPKLEG